MGLLISVGIVLLILGILFIAVGYLIPDPGPISSGNLVSLGWAFVIIGVILIIIGYVLPYAGRG